MNVRAFQTEHALNSIYVGIKQTRIPIMIERTIFPDFPDEAIVWVYIANRKLNLAEENKFVDTLNSFFSTWQSHGRVVKGAATILENQILVVTGFVPGGELSGCGIDASIQLIKRLAMDMSFSWTSGLSVVYRNETGDLAIVSRPEFRKMVKSGVVTGESMILDLGIQTLSHWRFSGIEKPAADSWHARVFKIPVAI